MNEQKIRLRIAVFAGMTKRGQAGRIPNKLGLTLKDRKWATKFKTWTVPQDLDRSGHRRFL